ncbi:MAG: TauD/TfdA family dioxygenase [Rhizobiales bacterium]|nr:TauD/TfdA family dioxygenase [Hyphomicrobiales bacterium]NRB14971.1 TauD/TfdA family dioxygenase [Hyphomicrobiales bacterium]
MIENFDKPPQVIVGPSAWIGEDMATNSDVWLTKLTEQDIHELETAANNFIDSSKNIGEISKSDFPLPTLAIRFAKLRKTLIDGIGFEVIRGLPVTGYSQELSATIFCGIGAHLGKARSQNAKGHILGHVRDIGVNAKDTNTRIYQTADRQTFHTDSADLVGLMCLKTAKIGGKSLLVSIESIYNEMQATRPDLLEILFEPIATDRRGEVPEGEKPYFEIPVLNWFEGKLTGMYQRQYIDSAQRFETAKRLTAKHVEALDYFDSLANDKRLNFGMQLQVGDMQFVYNHSQLHDREGFTDWPELDDRRHLFRLWLSLENDRALPEVFKQRYGSIEIGERGGIITKNTKLTLEIDGQ